MNAKDKSVPERIKAFFKSKKNYTGFRTNSEISLSDDILKGLSKESSYHTRLRFLKELRETVETNRLENNGVEKLWNAIKDIFNKEQPQEIRNAAFLFLQSLIKGQYDQIKIMRAHFFRVIEDYDQSEDIGNRLDLLNVLSKEGKDNTHFEEKIGPFLLKWLDDIKRAGKIEECLEIVLNLIKFNVYLGDEVIAGFVLHIHNILYYSSNSPNVVNTCLHILDAVIAFSSVPPDSLPHFIRTLCKTVNYESYCENSWKIMKNLLGTHMGHSAMYTMCRILQEQSLKGEVYLLRGAVFYIHTALWGNNSLRDLRCLPNSVLPSILQAVQTNHSAISYEAVLGVRSLVNKLGHELQDPAWSIILEILSHINKENEINPNLQANLVTIGPLHDTLTTIEKFIETGNFGGNVAQFFAVIEECSHKRPENSVLALIHYHAKQISPTEHLWLTNLYNLLHKYFKPDVRSKIRLEVLKELSEVVKLNRLQYEEELIDRIVIPHTINIHNDNDVLIRETVAKLLIDLCTYCESKKCLEMLAILEKILYRPFEAHYQESSLTPDSDNFSDIKTLVTGIIKIFTIKIHKLPSSHAIKIYKMLVHFLELHYSKPKIFENSNVIRKLIFDCFLKMRADATYHLGYVAPDGHIRYSPYLCVSNRMKERGPAGSPPPQSPALNQQPFCTITYVYIRRAFKVFMKCLKHETDWEVLSLILQEMPKVLQNKSIILSKQGNNELDLLVDVLCEMMWDKNLPESLKVKLTKSDFHSAILNVLVTLPSYHCYLDQSHQQKMIRCLTKCISNSLRGSFKQCIDALMISTLEMKDVMVKMLPELLLSLSKISQTVHIAIPVLEFLSTLTQLPMVFASFVDEQYMAVFAISFPYTNPFNYNHYTVSLAHFVIAVWFLKCRLPFRKNFVKFITSGLQTNVLTPFEETALKKPDLSKLNIDSSDRKRSSSLTEQGSRRRSQTVSARMIDKPQNTAKKPVDKGTLTFYEELTETCIDLMARYAFSPCSALPRRHPTAEFLLNSGQSMHWIVGNKLITVTTSGCSQKVLKHGVCDKCWTFCNILNESRGMRTDRSNSNDSKDSKITRQNSNDKSNTNTSASSPTEEKKSLGEKLEQLPSKLQQLVSGLDSNKQNICACWCQGWAEIHIRRPTGDMSWVMRIQNQIYQQSIYDFPLNEISTLYMPSLNPELMESNQNLNDTASTEDISIDRPTVIIADQKEYCPTNPISVPGSPVKPPSRQNSRDSIDEEIYYFDDGTKARNPVRRSNSSPEMSNFKNPFLHLKLQDEDKNIEDNQDVKKCKQYCKDMRVSCEAIPEEMAGTTPPTSDHLSQKLTINTSETSTHPSLLSCHSYPGSSPPQDSSIPPKPNRTVPQSPNINTQTTAPQNFQQKFAANQAGGLLLKTYKSESLDSVKYDKLMDRPKNLPNLMPLSGKPPQSPTQTSPRLSRHHHGNEIEKSASASALERNPSLNLARERAKERKSSGSVERLNKLDPNQTQMRDRCSTISVMSPANRKPRGLETFRQQNRSKEAPKSGINPSFVFLQLYHRSSFGDTQDKPLLVPPTSDIVRRAMFALETIPPYETHSIGVVYVREGQVNNQVEILRNRYGSLRYVEFLQNLGTLIKLQDVDPQMTFLGGLDHHGGDGKFTYIWQDDIIKIMFHVATMMPTDLESEPNCNNKKRHIGNNNVTIVYNESGEEYNIQTIKSQFNFACVIIHPLDHNLNKVVVKYKDELADLIGHKVISDQTEPKIVSDQNVAILARQLALHANLASLVQRSLSSNSQYPYASNWLERLRKIKNIKNKIMQEMNSQAKNDHQGLYPTEETSAPRKKQQMEDFTEYT